MAGWFPLFRSSAVGGPSGKAIVGMAIEPGMFKNIAQSFDSLQASGSSYAFPADLTADGYPKNGVSLTSNVYGQIALASNLLQSEQFVLKWRRGTGRVDMSRGAPGFSNVTATAGSIIGGIGFKLELDGTAARCVFQFDTSVPASVSLAFVSGVTFSGDFSGLVLCRLADEAALDAATTPDEYFSDSYVDAYKVLNPKIVRTMGWANPNFGNVSQFRYLPKWDTSFNINSAVWAPGAWSGRTTQGTVGATSPYTCGSQPDATGAYVDGEMIQFQFDAATAGVAITLNVGGRGIRPCIVGTGASTGSLLAYVNADTLWTATFDKVTNAFWCQEGGQTPCIPYELQAGFANRVNAHLWTNTPVYVDDASVTAITQALRDKLNSGLDCFFEYGNEPWNNGFPMAHYLTARGAALGFDPGNARQTYGAQALRVRKIMELATAAWAPRTITQLQRVMNCMSIAYGNVPGAKLYLLEGDDLNGTAYPNYATEGYSNYDTAPNRPIDICDVLSYGTYYQGAQTRALDIHYVDAGLPAISTGGPSGWTTGLLGAADAFAAGGSTNIANSFAFLDWDIRQGTANGTPGDATLLHFNSGASIGYGAVGVYSSWETAAASYDSARSAFASPLPPLTIDTYEGANESWYIGALSACTALGLSSASTVTLNIGSHPAVSWASNPLENGSIVGFTTSGGLPDGGEIGVYNTPHAADENKYFVVNRTNAGFDISLTPGGAAITLSGTQSGTQTATGSIYGGKAGRIAALLDAFKKHQLFYDITRDQFTQFMAFSHSRTPVYFLVPGPSNWAMSTGDLYAEKYQSWYANVYYNTH